MFTFEYAMRGEICKAQTYGACFGVGVKNNVQTELLLIFRNFQSEILQQSVVCVILYRYSLLCEAHLPEERWHTV